MLLFEYFEKSYIKTQYIQIHCKDNLTLWWSIDNDNLALIFAHNIEAKKTIESTCYVAKHQHQLLIEMFS